MPRPGDFGLVRIEGILGFFVLLGQWFIGDYSWWTHAFVLLDDDTIIEARPGGAQILPLSEYDGREILWSEFELTPEERHRIVAEARDMEGVPYSFADYAALFVERIGFRFGIIKGYVADSGHMICSQLVDEAYKRAGLHIFRDGRLSQDVSPGDLEIRMRKNLPLSRSV